MGQKQKGEDRKSKKTRQKNKRGDIKKWDQTNSPEIPDRGETSEILWPPFRACTLKRCSKRNLAKVSINFPLTFLRIPLVYYYEPVPKRGLTTLPMFRHAQFPTWQYVLMNVIFILNYILVRDN